MSNTTASSQEKLLPSSISSNTSNVSTCSEISTTAVFTDLSQLSSSSNSNSSSENSSSSSADDDTTSNHAGDEDSTCETRTLRDESATPIMDPDHHVFGASHASQRYFSQTQVGDYELVDNPSSSQQLATPHSPSTPDLLYPHTHLTTTPPANLPINQNGLPIYDVEGPLQGDLDLDLDRQQALYFSADLMNSNVSNEELLEDSLSHLGSADHLIHGGHSHFLSVNNSRPFVHGKNFSLI